MANTLPALWRHQFTDDNGDPLSLGTVTWYLAGTDTLATVYSDLGGTVMANPKTLGASAKLTWYQNPTISLKMVVKNASGVTVDTQDLLPAVPESAGNLEITGTAGENLTAAQAAYLNADGSWYRTDADAAATSVLPEVGFVVSTVLQGETVTIRKAGELETSGLTPGSAYYLSATAGAITSTAPTLARFVGIAKSATKLMIGANPGFRGITVGGQSTGDLLQISSNGVPERLVAPKLCDGRLTLTTAVPVTVTDVTGAATVYFTPYKGNQIGLYTGSAWKIHAFSEMSLALSGGTASRPNDIFLDYNDGTPQLTILAWSSDTARATALVLQDGVYVKTGDTQQRYLGTLYLDGSKQCADSLDKRHCWNYHHRLPRILQKKEATDSWTYTTDTYQQARAQATNQVDVVVGVAESMLALQLIAFWANSGEAEQVSVTFGEDAITASADAFAGTSGHTAATAQRVAVQAVLRKFPAIGRHYYTWLEYSTTGGGTTTWYGDNGAATLQQSGITGVIDA